MACGPPRCATCNGSRSNYPRAACMFSASRTGFPAYIQSAVRRCERCASYAATIPKTPTSSFPSAAGQSVLLGSTGLSSASAMATTLGPCSTISGTRTSSTWCATPKWRPIASGTFGVDRCRRRQARRRFPLYYLGICRRVPLGNYLFENLDRALELFIGHRLDAAGMLQLHLPRHQQGAYLHVGSRLLFPHLCNGFRTALPKVFCQCFEECLVD